MSKIEIGSWQAWIGYLLVVISVLFACIYHYNHFYELLVLGLFLVLRTVVGKRITRPTYITLYVIFLAAGIICDLVLGIYLTGLWRYSYSHLWEYAFLYVFIYPFAGLVMLQTYVVTKTRLLKFRNQSKSRPLLTFRAYRYLATLLLVLLGLDIFDVLIKRSPTNLVGLFVLASISAFLYLSYISQLHGHNTVIEDIHRHPIKGLFLLLTATYFNALLHEVPNTFARQWIYTNWPLSNIRIASVPLVVLLVWPLLLIIPVASYYLILPDRVNKKR